MRFSFNTRALDSPLKADHGLCIELADEDVGEEGNGMELLSSALEDEAFAAAEEKASSDQEPEVEEDDEIDDAEVLELQREEDSEEELKMQPEEEKKDAEDNTEEEASEPRPPKRKRLARAEMSDEPDEQEMRKRHSRERRSALSTSLSVEEVIEEWIAEHGDAWNPRLRTVLEGRLLTHSVPITIAVVEGMLKRRLSER